MLNYQRVPLNFGMWFRMIRSHFLQIVWVPGLRSFQSQRFGQRDAPGKSLVEMHNLKQEAVFAKLVMAIVCVFFEKNNGEVMEFIY